MIKELWILVKMLFASSPSDFAYKDLDVMAMNHFPFGGKTFMSWCGTVIVREGKKEVVERFFATKRGVETMNHEKGHCVQAISENGDNWIKYYLSYFWHWVKHCPWVAPSSACYYINRYEVECFAKQHDKTYFDLESYTRDNLHGKYTIKDAKKLYKELGGTSAAWKKYVKTL